MAESIEEAFEAQRKAVGLYVMARKAEQKPKDSLAASLELAAATEVLLLAVLEEALPGDASMSMLGRKVEHGLLKDELRDRIKALGKRK